MEFFETSDIFETDNLIEDNRMAPKSVPINYDNPNEVAELMAWHLAKIFWGNRQR